jgi:hypothetical protein
MSEAQGTALTGALQQAQYSSTVGCISDVGILLADSADLAVVVFSDDMGPHKRIDNPHIDFVFLDLRTLGLR